MACGDEEWLACGEVFESGLVGVCGSAGIAMNSDQRDEWDHGQDWVKRQADG